MPDLSQQLRSAVDRVPAVSIDDAEQVHRRRRRRRTLSGGFAAIVTVLGVGIGGLATQTRSHPTVVSVEPATSSPPPGSAAVGTVVSGAIVHNVDFVNPSAGYGSVALSGRSGQGDGLAATTNGGVTWRVVTPLGKLPAGQHVSELAFSSPQVGYAVGGTGQLERTTDGARTWTSVPAVTGVVALAVSFGTAYTVTERSGGPSGAHAVLWRSADEGATWQSSPTPIPVTKQTVLELSPFGHAGLYVTGSKLYTSADAGQTWATRTTPCGPATDPANLVTADTDQDLWLVCVGPPGAGTQAKRVYRTQDGGQHWTLAAAIGSGPATGTIAAGGYVNQLTALSATTAYLGLLRGGVLESTDSGRTWHQAIPGGTETTYNLFDATSGVALVDGVAWRTTDGNTWSRTP